MFYLGNIALHLICRSLEASLLYKSGSFFFQCHSLIQNNNNNEKKGHLKLFSCSAVCLMDLQFNCRSLLLISTGLFVSNIV